MRSLTFRWLGCIALFVIPACAGGATGEAEPGESLPRSWELPGAVEFGAELQGRLNDALDAEGEDYRARTRHLRDDGAPRFANRLLLESSPYLRQHAHNPVNWFPWGDEAFAEAKRLGRPVLLSIGYSTCHWCHVMEEESFEDEEIAAYLNAHYVAIKVDREERPDIDAIYMNAVQMLTGRGGWPMTSWLTPERRPFFGGTYFPARDGDRGNSRGFLGLLREMRGVYDAQPEQVAGRAAEITEAVQRNMVPDTAGAPPPPGVIEQAAEQYRKQFDPLHGGLKRAPKFPSNLPPRLLFRAYRRTGEAAYREMAELTLTRMADGGIYDHVGGGFHRYSTDARWLVPHFEKMLYDNALLVPSYLEAFQIGGDPAFAATARDVLDYVAREMIAPGGGFYSATDADSLTPRGEREEGWFFTWTPSELAALLTPAELRLVSSRFGVSPEGNFEGRNILHAVRPLAEACGESEPDPSACAGRLATAREKLYRARLLRPAPLLDDKILVSWNGLMISAFARGGFVLDEPEFVEQAVGAADFVLERMRVEGRLRRSYRDGKATHNAYLDDYAFLIAGLLDLYEVDSEIRWLREAISLQRVLDDRFLDAGSGGYFMTSDDHESLLAREKPSYDGAEPSGNAVAALNLMRLQEWTLEDGYRRSADALLKAFGNGLRQNPRGFAEMLLALDFLHASPKEIVIVTPDSGEGAEPFLEILRESFLPNQVRLVVRQGADAETHAAIVPLVRGKKARRKKTTAYVCEGGTCRLPTDDPAVFAEQLGLAEAR